MTVNIGFSGLTLYLLIFARFAGMITFNPLLARNNVPAMVRTGLSLFLTLLVAPMVAERFVLYDSSGIGFLLALLGEVAIGYIYGYVFQIFYYFMFFAGDLIDTDIGLSMAKTFDPATNIQSSFVSSLVTILFAMYVFASGSHLALIRIFTDSFVMLPPGSFSLSTGVLTFAINLFSQVFLLVLRLAAPFMVAEFVLQSAMGILMRFVPQISVFVINFQMRILLGMLMLLLFAPYIGQFIDDYVTVLFDNLVYVAELLSSGG